MKQRLQFIQGIILILLFFFSPAVQAAGEENETKQLLNPDQMASSQLENLNIDELKGFWEDILNKYDGYLPESQKGSLYDFISGEKKFSMKEWFKGILNFAFHEFIVNGKLLGSLILLTVFSMFLQTLQNSFEKSTVSKVAYSIVFMVLIIIALNSFHVVVDYTNDAIGTMIQFILALIPLMLALMASSGGLVSAAFFHPVILFMMNTSGLFIQYIVLPLLFLSALLSIVSILTEHYKVTQLASMLRNWSIGLLGMFLTVFLGVISVQGASAAVADGVTDRKSVV